MYIPAQERGKWWVVGSAWEGQAEVGDKQTDKQTTHADQRMMELARKQRMNTDVRRSIFCVIMSAEVRIMEIYIYIYNLK